MTLFVAHRSLLGLSNRAQNNVWPPNAAVTLITIDNFKQRTHFSPNQKWEEV